MRTVLILACTVGVSACIDGSPTGNTNELPERRGQTVASGVYVFSDVTWSPDGTEVVFQADGQTNSTLQAAAVGGGSPRTLDGPRDEYLDVSAGADGSLYFVANTQANGRRVGYHMPPGGPPQVITNHVPGTRALVPGDGAGVLPAPDGVQAAYIVAPDSLFLYTPATGARRFVAAGCERVVVFSPAADEVICHRGGSSGRGFYDRVRLDDGSAQSVTLVPDVDSHVRLVRWDDQGIRSFVINGLGLFAREESTGTLVQAFTQLRAIDVVDGHDSAWSPDGQRLAYWSHICLDAANQGTCRRGQSVLHVFNLQTRTSMIMAVAHGSTGGQAIAFAPDSRRLAYVFENGIYLPPAF